MGFIPDWAPNIHPMLIHFPIVFLLTAVLLDALNFVFRRRNWLHSAALFFYAAGVVSVIGVYLSGRQAADSVTVADSVYPAISDHANWALRSLWFWSVLVVLRFALLFRRIDRKPFVLALLVLVGIVGNWFIFRTADQGAALVYKYGVGVKTTGTVEPRTTQELSPASRSNNLVQLEDGTIEWEVREDALWILKKMLRWNDGEMHKVITSIRKDRQNNPVLSFILQNNSTQFLFPEKFASISLEAVVDAKGFQGGLFLVHHFLDSLNYDFLRVEQGKMSLGRLVQGRVKILSSKPVDLNGWTTLKVVGTKGHFRGYLNGELVVHGHGKDYPPGEAGLLLQGRGEVLLKKVVVKPLEIKSNLKGETK